jgi:fumarylpyruvate hydrolase
MLTQGGCLTTKINNAQSHLQLAHAYESTLNRNSMTDYVFTPPASPSIAVAGSGDRFPIRRVFCVGRNYAAHAREMGNDPDREAPFFFMKPADAVVDAVGVLPYPSATSELHHEVEMVVALGAGGVDVAPADALTLVWGYGVGLDLTRRDLQAVAKDMRRPWDFAKGFDASAPCSALHPVGEVGHPHDARIWLEVNGAVVQDGTLKEMIWPVADIISQISHFVALAPGDLIFSGTPAGVGALQPGDRVRGGVDGVADFNCEIGRQARHQE